MLMMMVVCDTKIPQIEVVLWILLFLKHKTQNGTKGLGLMIIINMSSYLCNHNLNMHLYPDVYVRMSKIIFFQKYLPDLEKMIFM